MRLFDLYNVVLVLIICYTVEIHTDAVFSARTEILMRVLTCDWRKEILTMFIKGLGIILSFFGGCLMYRGYRFNILADMITAVVFIIMGMSLVLL